MYDLIMEKQDADILPARLQDAIDLRGTTPAKLARQSSVSKSTISLILAGERPNTPATLVARLARALLVSVDYLVGITEDPEPKALGLGDSVIRLAQTASRLPLLRQHDLLRIAETFEDAIEETKREMNVHTLDTISLLMNRAGRGDEMDKILSERLGFLLNESDDLALNEPGNNEDSDDADGDDDSSQDSL